MGPNGMGPMSGRAGGNCMGFFGRNRGRGNGNMFFATGRTGWQRWAPEQELAFLRNQSKDLEERLQKTRERIAKLEMDPPGSCRPS